MAANELGDFIKSARIERGLTLEELRKKIHYSGAYISMVENGKKQMPSYEFLSKLATGLDIDFYELMNLAGYAEETINILKSTERVLNETEWEVFYNSMTPEEQERYADREIERQIKESNILEYQKKRHVRIEDFLNDTKRKFYINDSLLSEDDIKALISQYKDREKDYPSSEQIEKEFEKIKATKEENKKKIETGEAVFIANFDYDINTD